MKYEIITDEMNPDKGHIRALKSIPTNGVHEGDIGGIVDGYHNLSQEGDCWICYHARVSDNALVRDNAYLENTAAAYGNAIVEGYAVLFERSEARHNARVGGNAILDDSAKVWDNAQVLGNACVSGSTLVNGHALILGECEVAGRSQVGGYTIVLGGHHMRLRESGTSIITGMASEVHDHK